MDGRRWFLLNASPDVRDQLPSIATHAPDGVRHVPIEGVLLTDAELDHTTGLLLLREAGHLPVCATAAVRATLEEDSRILPLTRAFADVPLTELVMGVSQPIAHRDGTPSGLSVEAFPVPAGPPRFARRNETGHTVGLMLVDEARGTRCAFVPACGALDAGLLARLASADILLFDGTFWSDDELIALGVGTRMARQMDHLPIAGPGGSLELLATLPCTHRVYTHINNTNPMLVEASPERARVVRAGLTVGFDGQEIHV